MEFIIKEYGGIIILLICFSIAIGFISAFLTKCESIENTLLNVLFYHWHHNIQGKAYLIFMVLNNNTSKKGLSSLIWNQLLKALSILS